MGTTLSQYSKQVENEENEENTTYADSGPENIFRSLRSFENHRKEEIKSRIKTQEKKRRLIKELQGIETERKIKGLKDRDISDFTIASDELGVGRNNDVESVYPDYYPGGKRKSRKQRKPKKVKKSKKNRK